MTIARTGVIESFDQASGEGVILSDLGERAFFYSSAIAGTALTLNGGAVDKRVRFDAQKTNRGLRARNVRPE